MEHCSGAGRYTADAPKRRLDLAREDALDGRAEHKMPGEDQDKHKPVQPHSGGMDSSHSIRSQRRRTRKPGRMPKGWEPVGQGSPLKVLIQRRMIELGATRDGGFPLSYMEVEQLARDAGGSVSHTTVGLIIREDRRRPTEETVQGLALGLGLTVEEINEAIRRGDAKTRTLSKVDKLSPESWAELLRFIDLLIAGQERSGK